MEEMLELAFKRISELEKKLEIYYELLKIGNELDFILNGTYILEEDIQKFLEGNY